MGNKQKSGRVKKKRKFFGNKFTKQQRSDPNLDSTDVELEVLDKDTALNEQKR